MSAWIAFLRGINVGGRNLLRMKDLVGRLESAGLDDVRTYVQSGNVVFRSTETSRIPLEATIGESIRAESGVEANALVLNHEELDRAIAANPFPDAESARPRCTCSSLPRHPKT